MSYRLSCLMCVEQSRLVDSKYTQLLSSVRWYMCPIGDALIESQFTGPVDKGDIVPRYESRF